MITLALLALLLLTGCSAGRVCQTVITPMYWSDGSMTDMTLRVCHPRITVKLK